jgi:hypothetical protein
MELIKLYESPAKIRDSRKIIKLRTFTGNHQETELEAADKETELLLTSSFIATYYNYRTSNLFINIRRFWHDLMKNKKEFLLN